MIGALSQAPALLPFRGQHRTLARPSLPPDDNLDTLQPSLILRKALLKRAATSATPFQAKRHLGLS